MTNCFSKERRIERFKGYMKLGRVKFSLIFAILFILFYFVMELVLNMIFMQFRIIQNYSISRTPNRILIQFIIWFILSYFIFWKNMEKEVKNDHE